jgi:hypothetical protein
VLIAIEWQIHEVLDIFKNALNNVLFKVADSRTKCNKDELVIGG